MMRSIYVTEFYKKNFTYNNKIELANKMRLSPETAAIHYNKINELNFNNNDELIIRLQTEIYNLKQKIPKLENNNIDIKNSKLFNKRKNDIKY